MRQLIVGNGSISTGGSYYTGLSGADVNNLWTTTEAQANTPVSCAGTLRNLRVKVTTTPGSAGETHVFAVLINGVASALSVTITNPNTEGVNIANDVTVAVGDYVTLRRVNTTFDAADHTRWSLEFEGDTAYESWYGVWAIGQLAGGGPFYHAPFMAYGSTSVGASKSLAAVAGAITRYDVIVRVAPGAGTSDDFLFVKNGVNQNGSGGTPDTRMSISGTATTGSATGFSLAVSPGDLLQIKCTQTGAAATTHVGISTRFVANTDGRFTLSPFSPSSAIPNGATNWAELARTMWTTTEANARQTLDAAYWISSLYVNADAPGAAKSYTFTLRLNGVTPTQTPTVTITGTATPTTGSDVDPAHLVAFVANDTIALQSAPSGSPTSVQVFFSLSISDRDPSTQMSLCGVSPVYVWMELQTDSGVKSYAKENIPLDGTYKEGRVLSFGSITRAFSRDRGGYETATASIELSDTDRVLRGLANTGTLLNKRCDIFAASDAGLRTALTPRRLMQGIVRRYKPLPDLQFRVDLEDFFGSQLSDFSGDRTIPRRLFTVDDFPNILNAADDPTSPGNPTLVGKPVPIGYGLLSDETFSGAPVGVVPCVYVGRRTVNAFEWDEYVVCGHAVKSIDQWFAAASIDAFDLPRELMPGATEGVDFLIPANTGWVTHVGTSDMYRDFNGNRYTVIYARGPRSDAAREGKVPFTLNVHAVEDVGDGTGDLIESLPEQIEHLICNWILQSYTSGDWPAIPTIGTPPLDRFDATSTQVVRLASVARVGGSPSAGYLGAFMLGWQGQFHSVRDIIADACRSCDIDIGLNKDGQLFMSIVDVSAAVVKAWGDVVDVLKGSFDIDRDFDRLANRIEYRYQQQYIQTVTELVDVVASGGSPVATVRLPESLREPTSDWLVDHQAQEDATSITNHGETRLYDLSLPYVRDTVTADDVVAHLLASLKNGPVHATWDVDLCGTDVENGDNETLTEYLGMSATGWTDRLLRNEEHTVDLDALTVTLVARDLE